MSRHVPLFVSFIVGIVYWPRVLLNPLLGIFRPLDKAVLNELFGRLDPESAEIAQVQCGEVNLVRCVTAKTSEIDMYRLTWTGFTRSRTCYFSRDKEEYVLARMDLLIAKKRRTVVRFFVVRGFLFSMDFDTDISDVRNSSEIEVLEFKQKGE
jgi:hypothetical protein